jgi:putative transposase
MRDRAKGGAKRSMLTEAAGIPFAMKVAPANRHDMKLVAATLAGMMCARPADDRTIRLCLDLGYDYDDVRFIVFVLLDLNPSSWAGATSGKTRSSVVSVRSAGWSSERTAS